jgi:DNA-binding PadR family transcriptional regulator
VRRPANALALAVLALLYEKPMHPYEMSTTLRHRRKEDSIKINYGSLYAVVESLERNGLIEARERVREGRRPERTIYALTEAGDAALASRQFTDFEAALSLLAALPPETVGALLGDRLAALEVESREYDGLRKEYPDFPRLFMVEAEYRAALRTAEIGFVRGLLADIDGGTLGGIALWRRVHELKAADRDAAVMPTLLEEFGDVLPPEPEV